MNSFTLDGRSTREWNIGLSGSGVFSAPVRRGEEVQIPGRNGSKWIDEGVFNNITVEYPCWIARGFDAQIDDFRAWLMAHADGYYRLEDTYHPDEFRLARVVGPFEPNPGTLNKSGRFTVTFDCDPRRFLKSGDFYITLFDQDKTGTLEIFNPTYYDCAPILELNRMGIGTIYVGDGWIEATNVVENITLDCETLVTMRGTTPVYVEQLVINSNGPITIPQGVSEITETISDMDQDIDIMIKPRWWTI